MPAPPKHPDDRARRNASIALVRLPSEGRTGKAPTWPLGVDVSVELEVQLASADVAAARVQVETCTVARERAAAKKRLLGAERRLLQAQTMKKLQRAEEAKLWRDLWRTPQATQWERLRWTREVAQYVRHKVKAEAGSLDDAKESRQLADRLGLTPLALLRLRWEILPEAVEAPAPRSKRNATKYGDLRVVAS